MKRFITIGGQRIDAAIIEWLQPTSEPSVRVDLVVGVWAALICWYLLTR